jgi:hypothetical protein
MHTYKISMDYLKRELLEMEYISHQILIKPNPTDNATDLNVCYSAGSIQKLSDSLNIINKVIG